MFSVVIPTMWSIPHYTLELVKNLTSCDLISEVIIIDNAPKKYEEKEAYKHNKVIIKQMNQNIFVNPAWNMGVEMSKCKYVVICNDDVILKPTEILRFLLNNINAWDCVGLAPGAYEVGGSFKLNVLKERTFGWGCFMVVKKDKWNPIPNEIKIFFGDDWLVKTYNKVKSLETPLKVKTRMSTTSKTYTNQYFKSDGANYKKHIAQYKPKKHSYDNIEIDSEYVVEYSTDESSKISVIMPSYLGVYTKSRSNPIEKFNRAVKSFLNQGYSNKELVIVSDGCELTNTEYEKNWKGFGNIKLVKISKNSSKWPGSNRQVGIDNATGDWITYLDADDILHHSHLTNIAYHINDVDDVIFNVSSAKALQFNVHGNIRGWLFLNGKKMHSNKLQEYISKQKKGAKTLELNGGLYFYVPDVLASNSLKFNTARIAHKRSCDIKWTDRSARGEDIIFSEALMAKYKYKLINSPTYIVCHIPGRLDI